MQNENLRLSDTEIIQQVLSGDTNAFESLLTRYKGLVLNIVKRHVPFSEAEEVAQNSFIRVFEALSTYKGEGEFKQWLSAITLRSCYDYWRKAYRSREIPMCSLTERHRDWLEGVISDQSESLLQKKGLQKEAGELLDWALAKLSPKDRMVVELVYLEGLTAKEAGALLGWTVSNVKVRVFRSRKRLQRILTEVIKR
jgi:RNA polymerase sigma-70 factor (ECF subfamily)